MLVEKEATMKSLHAFPTLVTYADVLKGKLDNEDEDNVSNMTEGLQEKGKHDEQSNDDIVNNRKKDRCSNNDNNSQSSKESVIKRINELSDELKKERKERYEERMQMQKEREENRKMLKGMQKFQSLILNLNDDDTNKEISFEVRKYQKN